MTDLPARYGRLGAKSSRTRIYVLSGVGVAALTAVVGYFGLRSANPSISATVLAYHVTSDHSVDVSFEVDKAPSATATCWVMALDVHGEEVGRVQVNVPTGNRRTDLDATVRSTDRPVTGEVESCTLTH